MKNTIFTGAGVAIVTPMNEDGSVNYEAYADLIDFQIENKTDAIITCGTTGESSTLSDEEHREVIRFAIDHTAGRVPVIAGAGSNDTAKAIEATKAACAAFLAPYYNKTSQRGLVAHFGMIAESVKTPMILYSVQSRTGVNIAPETALELSRYDNIVAIKEASGNISQVAKIRALCGDNLDVYSGNDDQIVPLLSLGGKGVISVLSNVAPEVAHNICQFFFDGKVAESAALQLEYLDLCNDLFLDVNPIPVKEALNMMGMNAGPCRMPLYEMTDAAKDKLAATLAKHGLL